MTISHSEYQSLIKKHAIDKEHEEWLSKQVVCKICGFLIVGVPYARKLRKLRLCMEHSGLDLRCRAITVRGGRCKQALIMGYEYCKVHLKREDNRHHINDKPMDGDRCVQYDEYYKDRCLNVKHIGDFCQSHYGSLGLEKFEDEFVREHNLPKIERFPKKKRKKRKPRKPKRRKRAILYNEYIQSDEWRAKSEAAKKRAGYRCQLCNRNGVLHTHHRTYENLGNERDEDLIVLDEICHKNFHRIIGKPKDYV